MELQEIIIDRELARLVDGDTPPLERDLADGLAVKHMQYVENYVDQVFRSASKGFPEGFEYVRCRRCTVHEELAQVTKKKGTRAEVDVARSDIYMMQYLFSYKGVMLEPRYLYLPFVSAAGCIMLGGSRFTISPILSDRVISIGESNIFVRLLRDRLTLEREAHQYKIDGRSETVQVVWALIYHRNANQRKMIRNIKANTSLMHYLLCKYGFAEVFARFGNCRPVVGGPEINPTTYPPEEWHICASSRVKPKGVGKTFWQPSNIHVAVRREDFTPMVRNMLGGFFYIVDHFPQQVLPESIGQSGETRMWMVLMGILLFSSTAHHGRLYADVQDHINSLDEYLDTLVMQSLADINIHVTDIYQLFALMIQNFNDWLLAGNSNIASMYGKQFSILYFVCFDITKAIFNLYFKLKSASKKELGPREINLIMNSTLKTKLVFSMTKAAKHPEISTISSPGDNKAFKITSMLVPQSSSSRTGSQKDRAAIADPTKFLHASIAEVGSYSNLPKSEPSGRSRLSLHVKRDANEVVVPREEYKGLLSWIQNVIKR